MNRSLIPFVAGLLGPALAGCDAIATSAAGEPKTSRQDDATPVPLTWRQDFESGLPSFLRLDGSASTREGKTAINELRPISGKRDLLVSAILRSSDNPGWACLWMPLWDSQAMDATKAIGFRFKARSNLARTLTLMLDSDAYPSTTARHALTVNLAATTSDYFVYFSQFSYSPRLWQTGGPCASTGDPSLCRATLSQVVSRLRAFQVYMVTPSASAGTPALDTAVIQLDDIQLLFEDEILL
ncbi:MAG TPA: hypothetical protein PKO15_01240 [Fibrobacteria bacterium]|nr:hypothetical protein [Fibrobacteria bacterium]